MVAATPCDNLSEVSDLIDDFDVIGVDEGQFVSFLFFKKKRKFIYFLLKKYSDLIPVCENAANRGKIVIVAALDGSFQRKPFGSVMDLVPKAEVVSKLTAVCMQCFRDAAFTKRIAGGSAIEEIGGSDKYIAVCRQCFMDPSVNKSPVKPKMNPDTSAVERII